MSASSAEIIFRKAGVALPCDTEAVRRTILLHVSGDHCGRLAGDDENTASGFLARSCASCVVRSGDCGLKRSVPTSSIPVRGSLLGDAMPTSPSGPIASASRRA